MGELRRKLAYLKETKNAIKDALASAGQEVKETDTFRSYADKIRASRPVLENLEVTENGEYTPPAGVDGFNGVNVNVPLITELEGLEIALDFSVGDMPIEAPNGTAVKSAIIKKPETLIPENIAKDVVVAGIAGTHEGGGGGGSSDGDTSFKDIIEKKAVNPTLPADLTKIGDDVFKKMTSLISISLPNGVTSIGASAFQDCSHLENISIPNGVTSIGGLAFYGCRKLALTSLPDSLTSLGSTAFSGCSELAITSIPSGLTNFPNSAFSNCTSLTEITFKSKPTTLPQNTFYNCTNLKTINVPWAEGEVANAPWGATTATINYNYVEG